MSVMCSSLRNRLKLGRLYSIGEINPVEEDILEISLGKQILLGKSYARFLFQFWKAKLGWGREFPGDMLIGTPKGNCGEYMNLLCGDLRTA